MVDISKFEEILEDDIHSHIYELVTQDQDSKRLGYVNRKDETIEISLPESGIDLTIVQSLTGLSESTGYVCWQTALYLTDWILLDPGCPFKLTSSMTIVELGAGVGGILVSLLGPRVCKYIATDQQNILKLLQQNYNNNKQSDTKKSKKKKFEEFSVFFTEFDWEYIDHGVNNIKEIVDDTHIDLIIACDTIYNDYLIQPFIDSFKLLMTPNVTGVVVGLQVRDEQLVEAFAEQVLHEGLKLYCVLNEFLSTDLLKGFVVYYVQKVV